MLLVLEVDLEIGGCGVGPGSVELARTVKTLDAREEVEPDIWWDDGARLRHLDRRAGVSVHGGVAHECLELVVRVILFLLELVKRCYEP